MIEEVMQESSPVKTISASRIQRLKPSEPTRLKDVDEKSEPRIDTGIAELSQVLGGGLVPGSVILIGGDPGIGKSTLLLQALNKLSANGKKVLYVSGEESIRQTKI